MKKYKLLKDLPFAKAGEIFKEMHDDEAIVLAPENWDQHRQSIYIDEIENLDEWFEEIKEPEQIYYVDNLGGYVSKIDKNQLAIFPTLIANLKSIGNYFETEEEAKKYLEYLKAKEVIKQDTKGFNPNWQDKDEDRFMGCWDFKQKRARFDYGDAFKTPEIYFKSREDISESFKKHPDEWKIYLTYEL